MKLMPFQQTMLGLPVIVDVDKIAWLEKIPPHRCGTLGGTRLHFGEGASLEVDGDPDVTAARMIAEASWICPGCERRNPLREIYCPNWRTHKAA